MSAPPGGLPTYLPIQLRITGIQPSGFPLSDVGIGWPGAWSQSPNWSTINTSIVPGQPNVVFSLSNTAGFIPHGYTGTNPFLTGGLSKIVPAAYGTFYLNPSIYPTPSTYPPEPFLVHWNGTCWAGLYDYSPTAIPGLSGPQHLLVGANVSWQSANSYISCGINFVELPPFINSGTPLNQSAIGWPSGATPAGGVAIFPPATAPQEAAAKHDPGGFLNLGAAQHGVSGFEFTNPNSAWQGAVVQAGLTYLPTTQVTKVGNQPTMLSYSNFTILPANYTIYVTYLGVGPV